MFLGAKSLLDEANRERKVDRGMSGRPPHATAAKSR
jgi:hypothetical protein